MNQFGIPAIAVSGNGGSQVSFTTLSNSSADSTVAANVYADLTLKLLSVLLRAVDALLEDRLGLVDVELGLEVLDVGGEGAAVGAAAETLVGPDSAPGIGGLGGGRGGDCDE